jgi:hypothetical protein
MAFETALEWGRGTTKQLRQSLQPTDPIEAVILKRNGTRYIMAEVTDDQIAMLSRIMDRHIDFDYVDLEEDSPRTIPVIKRLLGDGK